MNQYQSILDKLSNEIFSIFKTISCNYQAVMLPKYNHDGFNIHKICVDIITPNKDFEFTETIMISDMYNESFESIFIKHNIREILTNIKEKLLKLIDEISSIINK